MFSVAKSLLIVFTIPKPTDTWVEKNFTPLRSFVENPIANIFQLDGLINPCHQKLCIVKNGYVWTIEKLLCIKHDTDHTDDMDETNNKEAAGTSNK